MNWQDVGTVVAKAAPVWAPWWAGRWAPSPERPAV